MTQPSDKLLAELLLEVKQLKAAIGQLLTAKPAPIALDQWAVGSTAAPLLRPAGIRSANHLKRLRQEGVFQEGSEIRNVSQGERPTWEYNVPRCDAALKRYFDRLAG